MNTTHHEKRALTEALLATGGTVLIRLDPRRNGVLVPGQFRNDASLALHIGLNTRIPIPDLTVSVAGVAGTLSFGGSPYWCMIPWDAVYAIIQEGTDARVWGEDVPSELIAELRPRRADVAPAAGGAKVIDMAAARARLRPRARTARGGGVA